MQVFILTFIVYLLRYHYIYIKLCLVKPEALNKYA